MIAFADYITQDCARILAGGLLSSIAPRPIVRSWDWVCRHGRAPDGQPFDGDRMPWAQGVCDAWDDPNVREVVLMWGTRLGKTMVALQLMAKSMATNPMPGLFVTADEKLAKRTVRNKVYKVLSAIRELKRQLLPDRERSVGEIRLTESTWGVAWAGSESLLADIGVMYGWGNEFTKWKNRKTMDGLMLKGDVTTRFFERFKDFWHSRKIIVESSPGLKGLCNTERKFLESNQCRYHVPCPHCKHHQILKLGNGDGSGGIVFDKLADGRHDPDLAQRTAAYQCEKCHKLIRDEHRPRMMKCGKWAPRGCTVNKKGKLCGKPERQCDIWGGQLSSLYSLQLRWGDIARKFVEVRHVPANLQVFVNDWLADTWEPYRVKSEPEDVADRIATDDKIGVMPAWSTWLFAAVDVQAEYFKWAKVACGPDERVSVVDRGICDTWAEVYDQCVNSQTAHADGGAVLLPCLTLVDSGDGKKTDEVYAKCREWSRHDRIVIPCKGANTDLAGEPFQIVEILGTGTKKGTRIQRRRALKFSGVIRVRVNSFYYEPILQRWLDIRQPDDRDSLSVPADLADDFDFIRELCNGAQSDEPSKMDPDRLLWVKRWPAEANDFRDCLKYARCAMDMKFRGNWRMAEKRQTAAAAQIRIARPAQQYPPAQENGRRFHRRERLRSRRERVSRR